MVDFIPYHDIECDFPVSGQYGPAPRGLYYALLLFIILLRRQNWLTAGAAAYCLTYGGTAAIHALILTPILSLGTTSIPKGIFQLPNSTEVTVRFLAFDLDCDATLAIVGTGFLIVVPMAIWSQSFRHSAEVPILVLWIGLMFLGMICCLANFYALDGSASGPLKEFRFCSPGYVNSLPFTGTTFDLVNDTWNDTVWSYFENRGVSQPGCFYPCLYAKELLHRPGDATVIPFHDIEPPSALYWAMDIITAVIYGCVPLNIVISLTILVLRLRGYKSPGWKDDGIQTPRQKSKFPRLTFVGYRLPRVTGIAIRDLLLEA